MIAKNYLPYLKKKLLLNSASEILINIGKLSDIQLEYFRKHLPEYEIERDYMGYWKFTKK